MARAVREESDWIANGSTTLGFAAPESSSIYNDNLPNTVTQVTWQSAVTSRLLLEAGVSSFNSQWGWTKPPGALTNFTPVTEVAPAIAGTGVPFPFFTYRGLDNLLVNDQHQHNWRASISYVTGAHNIKVGYQGSLSIDNQHNQVNDTQLTYTFLRRCADFLQRANRPVEHGEPHRVVRSLCAGSMDSRASDAAGCRAV